MGSRVAWTPEARWWLREIYLHIRADRPEAALRVVRGIFQKAQTLVDFPDMGQRHPHRSGRNIRVLLYGHYRIVYEHGAAGDIRVLGVFHGALDLKRHLRLQ